MEPEDIKLIAIGFGLAIVSIVGVILLPEILLAWFGAGFVAAVLFGVLQRTQ